MQSFIFDGNKPRDLKASQYALLSQPPTDIGSGMQSVANALMARQAQYPTAPAGNPLMQGFGRMGSIFGMGGGLY